MVSLDEPSAILSHVYRADGSATFSQNGYTVVGAVNGPLEPARRDELPEEASLEINVRPATGGGGVWHLSSSRGRTLIEDRNPRAPSGIHPPVHLATSHLHPRLPTVFDPDHTPRHRHPRG